MNELKQELTEDLKRKFQTYNQYELNKTFIWACRNRYLDVVKYLLTSPELTENANIHTDDDDGFLWACRNGHLEVVKYLLTSPELTENANIHTDDDGGFRWACEKGYLDIVKYLLTSPDLNEHADIHVNNDVGFRLACLNGHLDIVKYLLTSPDLQVHAHLNESDFQSACFNNRLEVIQYMLDFDLEGRIDFQKTEYNLDWAIKKEYDNIIIGMMRHLKNSNPLDYLESLPKIENYNKELYEQVKKIEVDNLEVNPPTETVLYL